jgi:hypothetical protein
VIPAALLPTTGAPTTLAVPQLPALAGAGLVAQGFAFQPAGCLRATDALALTILP